jgi:hypothetical protein
VGSPPGGETESTHEIAEAAVDFVAYVRPETVKLIFFRDFRIDEVPVVAKLLSVSYAYVCFASHGADGALGPLHFVFFELMFTDRGELPPHPPKLEVAVVTEVLSVALVSPALERPGAWNVTEPEAVQLTGPSGGPDFADAVVWTAATVPIGRAIARMPIRILRRMCWCSFFVDQVG